MTKTISTILSFALGLTPALSTLAASDIYASEDDSGGESTSLTRTNEESAVVGTQGSSKVKLAAVKAPKPCAPGYFRSPLTNRCKQLVTVKESASTITTTTYNPRTGLAKVTKVCKSGYWWNKKTERCNKKKTCSIGYIWQSSDNTCKKIVCSFGFKVQDASNVCKRIVCEKGKVINQKTGNCVINHNGKYKECPSGWTLDLKTSKCALIGTKGSDDPRSIAAAKAAGIKQSANTVQKYALMSKIQLASIIISEDTSSPETTESTATDDSDTSTTKTCPEGKFLNPQTNRCKNLQTIEETTTGKTITTYDPETGEATVEKVCNEGYYLKEETNRCNKIPAESTSSSKTSSTSSISTSSTTKTCPEGKFLNPQTNRCKNLQTISESSTGKTITTYDPKTGEATTEKICNSGYVLNPDSNRCNKIKENKGEDYALEVPELGSEESPNFVAIGSVIAIITAGAGFVIFQFRHEIAKFFKKLKIGHGV